MIQSITFKNFKSYKSGTLHLAPLTFLIGPNASGKSNALEAIRLLSWMARGKRLEDIVRDLAEGKSGIRGNVKDLFGDWSLLLQFALSIHVPERLLYRDFQNKKLEIDLDLDDQLTILQEKLLSGSKWEYRVAGKPSEYSGEFKVEYNTEGQGRPPMVPCNNRQPIFYQLLDKARFPDKHKFYGEQIVIITKVIKQALERVSFLDPKPSQMRGYAGKFSTDLEEDGENVSGILYSIIHDKDQKTQVLDFIKFLPEQNFTDIDFIVVEETNDVMVRLVESFGDQKRKVNARLLSDGTLRVMAIAAALLSAPEGSLVIIEEVDNGVHPSRAKDLVNQIQKVAKERQIQVLLTSHNPALIDAVPDDAIGDIVACYRDPKNGDSRLMRLKDLNDFGELVAQGPVGELMKRQILDKYLKNPLSDEEKKQRSQAWLEDLLKQTAK